MKNPSERASLGTQIFRAIVLGVPLAMVGCTADDIVGLIICAIALALFAVWYFYVGPMLHTRTDTARVQVKELLTNACDEFESANRRWPAKLEELVQKNENGGPYLENAMLIDPWGMRYLYDANGPMNEGKKPDVWCVSPETKSKVGNWSWT